MFYTGLLQATKEELNNLVSNTDKKEQNIIYDNIRRRIRNKNRNEKAHEKSIKEMYNIYNTLLNNYKSLEEFNYNKEQIKQLIKEDNEKYKIKIPIKYAINLKQLIIYLNLI